MLQGENFNTHKMTGNIFLVLNKKFLYQCFILSIDWSFPATAALSHHQMFSKCNQITSDFSDCLVMCHFRLVQLNQKQFAKTD